MAETWCFFSQLVDGLASYVQQRVSMRGRTDHFLGMIDGSNTTILLAGADGLINGRDMMLLLSAG